MEKKDDPSFEALEYAQSRLMLVAVRALMETHPNPAAFRESWAHCLSLTMRDHVAWAAQDQPTLEESGAAFRLLQPVWESYFPDSVAASSRPKPGDTSQS